MKRWLVLAAAACAHPPPPKVQPLADTAAIPIANAELVVELGDALYVFEHRAVAIVRGGAVVARASVPVAIWGTAAAIPALDGEGRWVVATDLDGGLWRVRATGELEAIADQLGVARARAIGGAGGTIALATEDGLAVSTDGVHLARYQVTGNVAVAPNRLAIASQTAVEVWDLAKGTRRSFPIAHGHPAFLDPEHVPRLVVATSRALFVEEDGQLARVATPPDPDVVIAGPKLWVSSRGHLYIFDGAGLVQTATPVPRAARVFGSHTGDVWIADGIAITGHSLEQRADDPRWRADIEPVFRRVCAHCHLPGGSADLDLSTPAAWAAERGEIARRVITTRTMPPAGTDLSDTDRDAIARWLR